MKTNDTEEKETQDDVSTTETPEQETSEQQVPLTEEFQREFLAMCGQATKQECAFMRDCIYQREEELRQEDEENKPTSMDDYKKVKEAQD